MPDTERIWTKEEIMGLGATTDLVTAGQILGKGRTTSYKLAKRGEFPVEAERLGGEWFVRVYDLLRYLRML
ncbi:helix-turn-helix domain-containing protein [Longispora sp. NPDC051575]|uniref:helix-turn-helix domain-containing protein n=1 Tax=Longispora sp. NPDC051575 TaxID=3154943 RepID=UPI003417E825